MFKFKIVFYRVYVTLLKIVSKLLPMNKPLTYVGENSSVALAKSFASFGHQNVLIVTDKVLYELGVIDTFIKTIESIGIKCYIFHEVLPDPTIEVVYDGIKRLESDRCDAVVGFGGGSSMDAAKVISALAGTNRSVNDIEGVLKVKERKLPLYLIPTTAGTGSEITIAAVVSDVEARRKLPIADPVLLPNATALDPLLMLGLPPAITAATGMDALTHAVEAFISLNADKNTDKYAISATKLIFENLYTTYKDGKNIEAREGMALASHYAGIAFTSAGLGYVHGIAHQLGAFYHVPHGLANAIVLPHVLNYSKPKIIKKLSLLAKEIGLDHDGSDDEALATRFIQEIENLKVILKLPENVEKLQESDVHAIVKAALKESHSFYAVPRYMDKYQCANLVRDLIPS